MSNKNNNESLVADQKKSPFILPALPYTQNSLEPHISSNTLSYHHGKHHKAYVDNLNNLIKDSDLQDKSLEEIIMLTHNQEDKLSIFNNAAQVWNHTFFWHCMRPSGGGKPNGRLLQQIEKDFGSYESFAENFKKAGTTQFGSGWAWLVWDGKKLQITKTANADLPMTKKQKALLTADVWEHSYYLDYQNRRPDYLGVFLEKLVNWEFAERNFDSI